MRSLCLGGEPRPYLALFGLVYSWREAENEATVASFGTPLTRTRWTSVASLWLWLALVGLGRSCQEGQNF